MNEGGRCDSEIMPRLTSSRADALRRAALTYAVLRLRHAVLR